MDEFAYVNFNLLSFKFKLDIKLSLAKLRNFSTDYMYPKLNKENSHLINIVMWTQRTPLSLLRRATVPFPHMCSSRSTVRSSLQSKSFRWSPGGESPGGGSSSRGHPRVLCMVVTSPEHHEDRARHIGATWGNRDDPNACPDTHYLTSAPHPELHNVIISNYSRLVASSQVQVWPSAYHAGSSYRH